MTALQKGQRVRVTVEGEVVFADDLMVRVDQDDTSYLFAQDAVEVEVLEPEWQAGDVVLRHYPGEQDSVAVRLSNGRWRITYPDILSRVYDFEDSIVFADDYTVLVRGGKPVSS